MKIFKNALLVILICSSLILSYFCINLNSKSGHLLNEYKTRNTCEEIARSFSINYNNLFRDTEHIDKTVFKEYCTGEFYNIIIEPMEPQHEVSEEPVISSNDINHILSKVSEENTEVIIIGEQNFEYTSYIFTYYFKFNSENKIEDFRIISVQ